jgi:hypothetical protein
MPARTNAQALAICVGGWRAALSDRWWCAELVARFVRDA